MQNLEWYLADLKSTGKNTIETVEKSLTDMFIRLVRIYPCLLGILALIMLACTTMVRSTFPQNALIYSVDIAVSNGYSYEKIHR